MKKIILALLILLACSISAEAQTFTYVSGADSGAISGSTLTTVATGTFNVTAGNLVACGFESFWGVTPGSLAVSDTAGNQFIFGGGGNMGGNYNTTQTTAFYSITTASNASDVVTVNLSVGSEFIAVACTQWSVTATYRFVVDATPAAATGASGTTLTSSTFTTTSANELILGFGGGFNGTIAAGNIGGTGATLQRVNDTNGTSSIVGVESRTVTSIQTSITAAMTNSANNAWTMQVLSFSATTSVTPAILFETSTWVSDVAGSSASVTSPAIPLSAGQLAYVHCVTYTGNVITGFTVTSSPSNTFVKLNAQLNGVTGPAIQDSYALNVGAASTTFTCTPNTSAAHLSMVVLIYSGLLTSGAFDVQATGTSTSSSAVTTGTFSTATNVEVVIDCAGSLGAGPAWTAGSIDSATAILRQVDSISPAYGASYGACEDIITSARQTNITAAISSTGSPTSMSATAAAFKIVASNFAPTFLFVPGNP